MKRNFHQQARRMVFVSICFFVTIAVLRMIWADTLYAASAVSFSSEMLAKAEEDFGSSAVVRLLKWQDLINANLQKREAEKVDSVNRFINTISYAEDEDHWQIEDYWATPVEFIASGSGDCEDYTIAKYFTLRMLGIDMSRIRIFYVNVKNKKVPHMVLGYFPEGSKSPLVLDSLSNEIQPLQSKKNYQPIYSANEDQVWINNHQNSFVPAGTSSSITKWKDMLEKYTREN